MTYIDMSAVSKRALESIGQKGWVKGKGIGRGGTMCLIVTLENVIEGVVHSDHHPHYIRDFDLTTRPVCAEPVYADDMAVISAQALERIRTKGWVQGHLAPAGSDGPMCLGGTLIHTGLSEISPLALVKVAEIICEQFPDRIMHSHRYNDAIIDFNDHRDTTIEDVQAVLEKLATCEGTA